MKSKELLEQNIDKYLRDELQNKSFNYSKSKLSFKKKINTSILEIFFSLNRWNSEDNCDFWTMWSLQSQYYKKWYFNQWGEYPNNSAVAGCAEWNIPKWSRKNHFILTNCRNDEQEMEELKEDIFNVGIPYFEALSEWNNAAINAQESKMFYDKACDFYLIAGENAKAKDVLIEGVKRFSNNPELDQLNMLIEIKKRTRKYFNDSI